MAARSQTAGVNGVVAVRVRLIGPVVRVIRAIRNVGTVRAIRAVGVVVDLIVRIRPVGPARRALVAR